MSFFGNIFGAMCGDWRAPVLELRGWVLGGSVKFEVVPFNSARGRCVALFAAGRWTGQNYKMPLSGNVAGVLPLDALNDASSLIAVEVGDALGFPDFVPDGMAQYEEARQARRIYLRWTATYRLTPVQGDDQLSAIAIAGAQRFANVAAVEDLPTRGRLHYTISNVGTTRTVRWWNGLQLVAEGSRVGNGALTCTEQNGSGLTIACSVTYTADVTPDSAFLDVRWPKAYQIHYLIRPDADLIDVALTYPRTPEAVMVDNGADSFVFLSPQLDAGIYDYNVLQVDDDGVVQDVIVDRAPLTVYGTPAMPTITGFFGNAADGLTIMFDEGETGETFTLYYCDPDQPINYDVGSLPAPVTAVSFGVPPGAPVGQGATYYATTAAITGYGGTDRSGDYATVVAALDAAVAALDAGFAAGGAPFAGIVTAQNAAIDAAIGAYGVALGLALDDFAAAVDGKILVLNSVLAIADLTPLASWQAMIAHEYGSVLLLLGSLAEGHAGRYPLPGGALPDAAGNMPVNLLSVAQPFVLAATVRCVVRATKGGREEHGDAVTAIELNPDDGEIVLTRPNAASIQDFDELGLAAVVAVAVIEDDAPAAAVSVSVTIDGVTANTVALPDDAGINAHQVDVPITFDAPGWYTLRVFATSSNGGVSELSEPMEVYADDSAGVAPVIDEALVIGGR